MKGFSKLIVSLFMAIGLTLFVPMLIGAVNAPSQTGASLQACATVPNGSCCEHKAICGLNGKNYEGYHYVEGSCPPAEPE